MLTRVRSLFSRVFSIDRSTSQIRLDEHFDNIDDSLSDDDSFSEDEEKINEYSNRLITSMQIALLRRNISSLKHLLNNSDIDINHRDQYGMSYLEHAILIGNFDMVNLLIKYGCDLNQGNTFL
jgi:ankyrin repeat protein